MGGGVFGMCSRRKEKEYVDALARAELESLRLQLSEERETFLKELASQRSQIELVRDAQADLQRSVQDSLGMLATLTHLTPEDAFESEQDDIDDTPRADRQVRVDRQVSTGQMGDCSASIEVCKRQLESLSAKVALLEEGVTRSVEASELEELKGLVAEVQAAASTAPQAQQRRASESTDSFDWKWTQLAQMQNELEKQLSSAIEFQQQLHKAGVEAGERQTHEPQSEMSAPLSNRSESDSLQVVNEEVSVIHSELKELVQVVGGLEPLMMHLEQQIKVHESQLVDIQHSLLEKSSSNENHSVETPQNELHRQDIDSMLGAFATSQKSHYAEELAAVKQDAAQAAQSICDKHASLTDSIEVLRELCQEVSVDVELLKEQREEETRHTEAPAGQIAEMGERMEMLEKVSDALLKQTCTSRERDELDTAIGLVNQRVHVLEQTTTALLEEATKAVSSPKDDPQGDSSELETRLRTLDERCSVEWHTSRKQITALEERCSVEWHTCKEEINSLTDKVLELYEEDQLQVGLDDCKMRLDSLEKHLQRVAHKPDRPSSLQAQIFSEQVEQIQH